MSRNSQEDDMERPVSAGRVIADDKVSVVEEIKEKLIDPSKTSLMKNDDPRENMPSETGRSEPDRRPMSRMSSRSSKWEEVSELDPSVENKWKELLRKHNIGSAPSQKRKESLNDKGEEIDEKQGNEESPDLEMEEEEKVSFRGLVEKHGIGSRSISRASLRNRRSGGHSRQGSVAGVIQMDSHSSGLIPTFPEDADPSTEHGFDTKENEINDADDAECIERENVVTDTKTEDTSSSPVQSEPKENTSADEIIEKEEELNLDMGSAQNTDFFELNKETEEDKEGMVCSSRVCWLLATHILI